MTRFASSRTRPDVRADGDPLRSADGGPMTGEMKLADPVRLPEVPSDLLILNPPRRRLRRTVLADLAMIVAAVALATVATPAVDGRSAMWAGLYALGVVAALHGRRFYAARLDSGSLDDLGRIFWATATVATVVIAARVLLEDTTEPARFTLRLWVFTVVYLGAGRLGMAIAVRRLRQAGEGGRNTLIVGAGEIGTRLAGRLLARPELGLRPIGFLDKEPRSSDADRLGLPVLGASWDLEEVARRHGVQHVVLAFSTAPHAVLLDLAKRAAALGLDVSVVPRLFEHVTHRLAVEHVGGIPLLRAEQVDPKSWQFACKYAVERVLAALAVLALAPLFLALAIAVRRSSPGPVLFRQRRIGLDGTVFDILKFRTMRMPDADHRFEVAGDRAPGGVEGEDRRTRVGVFLRRWSLDELPQLLNVVRGEMALIGPRPERPEFVMEFERRVYRYGDRHRVKSGLTGWAQVHGLRGQTSLGERVEWDNFYIENWSVWLDLKIVVLTLPAVFGGRNAE
jgi:exopolysaccharide biosynthesis polyprenyl glycosylphosphotransferase